LESVPNPFNPKTTIRYALPEAGSVRLEIVDPSGRIVRTLVDRVVLSAGTQQSVWDGRDDAGRPAGTGTYFAKLRTEEGSVSTKLILLK
jgi:flagellar hook assembly protein FlgD